MCPRYTVKMMCFELGSAVILQTDATMPGYAVTQYGAWEQCNFCILIA